MNADDKRKFLKDVLHTMKTGYVHKETLSRVGEVLGCDRGFESLPGHVITQYIELALADDARERSKLEHRRKDDSLAVSDPRVYNKGVLDALQVVTRLERAAEAKRFSSDARLLGEVCDEITDLLRRPSREETKGQQCGGTGCGGACSTSEVGKVSPQEPFLYSTAKERDPVKHQPPVAPAERMGQTLHERLLDFGHHFDVQLLFYQTEKERQEVFAMYPASQGWTIDPTCWQRKILPSTTMNIRVAYRQVVQP